MASVCRLGRVFAFFDQGYPQVTFLMRVALFRVSEISEYKSRHPEGKRPLSLCYANIFNLRGVVLRDVLQRGDLDLDFLHVLGHLVQLRKLLVHALLTLTE